MTEEYRFTDGTVLTEESPAIQTDEIPAGAGAEAPQPSDGAPVAEYIAVPEEAFAQALPEETEGGPRSGSVSAYYDSLTPLPEKERIDPDGCPVGERAGFWPRLFAALIDTAVAAVIGFILSVIVRAFLTDRLLEPFFFKIDLLTVIFYISYKTYCILAQWKRQKTLGKKALRIRLISSETLGKADLWTVFFRETFGKFISAVCVVGDLMLLGKQHLPLYDRLADTEVVYDLKPVTVRAETSAAAEAADVPAAEAQDSSEINY